MAYPHPRGGYPHPHGAYPHPRGGEALPDALYALPYTASGNASPLHTPRTRRIRALHR